MELFKMIGIAVITAVVVMVLKATKPELAFAAMLTGSILLLSAALDGLSHGFSVFHDLTALTGVENSLVKTLLKIVGIGYIAEFSADLLTDFGASSLANKVELCGKVIIFIMSLPIIQSLLTLLNEFLSLI